MAFGLERDPRSDEELLVAAVARWRYTKLKTIGAERTLDRPADPAAPSDGTTLTLSAIAKEGLIRQHTAEKAPAQVEAALDSEPDPRD